MTWFLEQRLRRSGAAKNRVATTESGFGLIEMLVTVVILAFGLLGIAALQVIAKKNNFEAVQRTTATFLVHDIIERMRANTSELATFIGNPSVSSEPVPDCSGAGSACTPFQMSIHDLWQWQQLMAGVAVTNSSGNIGGLASPTACIGGPPGGGSGNYTIAIAWRGVTRNTDPAAGDCGADSGLYDDEDGNADAYRHVLVVNAYIDTSF